MTPTKSEMLAALDRSIETVKDQMRRGVPGGGCDGMVSVLQGYRQWRFNVEHTWPDDALAVAGEIALEAADYSQDWARAALG